MHSMLRVVMWTRKDLPVPRPEDDPATPWIIWCPKYQNPSEGRYIFHQHLCKNNDMNLRPDLHVCEYVNYGEKKPCGQAFEVTRG